MKIKGVYVGREDQTPHELKSVIQKNSKLKKQIKNDIDKFRSKFKSLNSKSGQREKMISSYGVWFATKKSGWIYGVCVDPSYSERHAFGLIEKIQQFNSKQDIYDKKFFKKLEKVVDENCQKYQDLSQIDKIHKAQEQAILLQQDLNKGINKVINKVEKIEDLEVKAEELKIQAQTFKKNSEELKKKARKDKMILIGIISIVSLIIICISIALIWKFVF